MDRVVARKMWRTLEPYHGMVYFVPEAGERYAAAGIEGAMSGYFASRSAPMGAVGAEVVIATFFNFEPGLVRASMAGVWDRATPAALVAARFEAVDAALRRMLGAEGLEGREVAEALDLARRVADACSADGRPLYAGHASLAWPGVPHLDLWHALTLVREFRGDGHVAALTAEGVDGCEALVVHAATGEVPAGVLQGTRAWPEAEWGAAVERLRARGWLDGDGQLTEAGRAHRQWVEDTTDRLALPAWRALGEDGCDRLRTLVRPWSKAIVAGGAFLGGQPS